jgi:site-specific recombinase XerD
VRRRISKTGHGFATELLRDHHADIVLVAELLGHADPHFDR